MDRIAAWGALSTVSARLYVGSPGSRLASGPGWFATLSGTSNSELNVCCVTSEATADAAADMLEVVGDLPVIVFTDSAAGSFRDALISVGFSLAPTAEALMRCAIAPQAASADFRIERVDSPTALAESLELTSQAHRIDRVLLDQTIGNSARSWRSSIWLARNAEGVAVSTVAIVRTGSTLGVSEMMTPPQYQRIGAGRALLTTALAQSWDDDVTDALLLSTPAGRRLYESLGFVALDESRTCYRGLDDDVLDAIGQ